MSFNRFIHRLFYPFVDWPFHLALNVSIVYLLFCLSVGLFSGSLFYPFIFLIFSPPILPFVGVNFVVHPSSIPTFAFHALALPFLDSLLHSISHSFARLHNHPCLVSFVLTLIQSFFSFASNVSNRSFYFTQTIFFRWVFGASREYLGVRCCLEKYTLPWALWISALSKWLGISYLLSHNWVTTEWL